jgi:hypothetical protein
MDSAGHSVLIENFRGDGVMVLKQVVDAGGVITLDQYDGLGHVVQETVTQKDGSYLQSAYAPDGALATQTFRHADGSRDIYTYGIVGKDYTSQHVVNDPSGHTVLIEQFHSDGSLALRQTMDAGAADGAPIAETARHLDGTRDVVPGVTVASAPANDVFKNAGGDNFVVEQASGHDTFNHFGAGDATGHDAIQTEWMVAADPAHPSVHISGQDTVFDHGHDASVALPDAVMPLTWHDLLIV